MTAVDCTGHGVAGAFMSLVGNELLREIINNKGKYITNTLDSTTTFKLENLKAGTYLMIALKEENNKHLL